MNNLIVASTLYLLSILLLTFIVREKAYAEDTIEHIASLDRMGRLEALKLASGDPTLGAKAVTTLSNILDHKDKPDPRIIESCAYILQSSVVDGSLEKLLKIAEGELIRDDLRTELFVAVCRQKTGLDLMQKNRDSTNDSIRASAISALVRTMDGIGVKALIVHMKSSGDDYTGTKTDIALTHAKLVLYMIDVLAKHQTFEEKLRYLLPHNIYTPIDPLNPRVFTIKASAESIFAWNKIAEMWLEDPIRARSIMDLYVRENAFDAEAIGRLINDLTTAPAGPPLILP